MENNGFNRVLAQATGLSAVLRFYRLARRGGHSERDFSGPAQSGQSFQVPTDAFELQFEPVGVPAHIAHAPVTRTTLPPAKYFLNPTTHPAQALVALHLLGEQFGPAMWSAQNAVGDGLFRQPPAAGLAPIGLVGHHLGLIARHDFFKATAVMHVGGAQPHAADQGVGLVGRDMRLVTVVGLAALGSESGVAIAATLISFGRRAPRGGQQRRIHQGAGFQDQPLLFQLPVDQPQELLVQAMLPQARPETHQSGFIRHLVLQTQSHKTPPRKPVTHQFLTLRIGQSIAMLQQTHLEKHQRRTRRPAGRRRIHRLQRRLHGPPVQRSLQPLQEIVGRLAGQQVIQQPHLRISGRLHVSLTPLPPHRSIGFRRGLIIRYLSLSC